MTTTSDVLYCTSHCSTVTRLEGIAILEALYLAQHLYPRTGVVVYTDADVWVKRYQQLPYLVEHQWHKPNGSLVKEIDILSVMWRLATPRVSVRSIPSHQGVPGNELAHHTARDICGKVSPMKKVNA